MDYFEMNEFLKNIEYDIKDSVKIIIGDQIRLILEFDTWYKPSN